MKRLYRSRKDQMLGGVAGGMAEYFGIDPTLARIAWLLLGLAGPGFILYIICWVIIPEAPADLSPGASTDAAAAPAGAPGSGDGGAGSAAESGAPSSGPVYTFKSEKGAELLGLVLIAIGGWYLLRQFIPWLDRDILWPLLLVAGGVFLLLRPGTRKP